jgi:prophage regulatory protein
MERPQSLLRIQEVIARTGLSRSLLYSQVQAGKFPAPVRVGERSSAWVDTEVARWIEERIAARAQRTERAAA